MIRPRQHTAALIGVIMGLAVTGVGWAQTPDPLEYGRSLFEGHCAACHGILGDGTGMEGNGMSPPPTSFRDPAALSALTDSDLEQAILAGTPNTGMRAFGTVLTSDDVTALIQYLRSLPGSP